MVCGGGVLVILLLLKHSKNSSYAFSTATTVLRNRNFSMENKRKLVLKNRVFPFSTKDTYHIFGARFVRTGNPVRC